MEDIDAHIANREARENRRRQVARVMPVVTKLLDFWEALPNDEKDLVRTAPRLSCLLDELDAAMEGDSTVKFKDIPQPESIHGFLADEGCTVDHSKYVGKCPGCHVALPGIA